MESMFREDDGLVLPGLVGKEIHFFNVVKCLDSLHAIRGPSVELLIMDDVLDLIISGCDNIASQLAGSPSVRNMYALQQCMAEDFCSDEILDENLIGKLSYKLDHINANYFSLLINW